MGSNSGCNYHAGGATTKITALSPNIIETHIFTKLDGQSLASTASTCHLLHATSSDQYLWETICDSTWNSINDRRVRQAISTFPGGYRSFFSDSFPLLRPTPGILPQPRPHAQGIHTTSELISAIDVRYNHIPVYSQILVTKTDEESFMGSTFLINLLDGKESVKMPLIFQGDESECMSNLEENMTFSWILIDPTRKRAGNFSSLRPVSVEASWEGSEIEVTYATILSGDDTSEFVECKIKAIFSCKEGKDVEMREVSFHVEDMYRGVLNGEKGVGVLVEAMESGERKKGNGEEKEKYEKYMEVKREKRMEKKRKESRLDMIYRVVCFVHILSWILFAICIRYTFM